MTLLIDHLVNVVALECAVRYAVHARDVFFVAVIQTIQIHCRHINHSIKYNMKNIRQSNT